jgi:hypothetical protein
VYFSSFIAIYIIFCVKINTDSSVNRQILGSYGGEDDDVVPPGCDAI